MSCSLCADRGVIFNSKIETGHHGSLELCSCIREQCRCGSRPPYTYFDEDSRSQDCPCRPFRYRLKAYQIMEELVRVPYVVLDDLGVQRGTEWEEETLYDLVDGRYSEERFTIVTTNVELKEVEQLSKGRLYSRLAEMCHRVEMDGPDWRKLPI